jgi:hypothetical protein
MTDFVLPASLFSGEPVERAVVLNQTAIDKAIKERDDLAAAADILDDGSTAAAAAATVEIPEPSVINFMLLPVTSSIDVEYTKQRGHNDNRFVFTPKKGDDGANETKFEPMERVVHNDKELKALTWLAKQVIVGWRTFKNSNGENVVFTEHNLEKLSEYSALIEPPVRAAYDLASLKDQADSGNSETSSAGSATQNEDQDGELTGLTAVTTK